MDGSGGATAGAPNRLPRDAQLMISLLHQMGIQDWEPRVINQLLEYTFREQPARSPLPGRPPPPATRGAPPPATRRVAGCRVAGCRLALGSLSTPPALAPSLQGT
jgi:hypothetical protein